MIWAEYNKNFIGEEFKRMTFISLLILYTHNTPDTCTDIDNCYLQGMKTERKKMSIINDKDGLASDIDNIQFWS